MVRDAGSFTGRVGDFALVLVDPVREAGRSRDAGLDAAAFVTVVFLGFDDELAVLVSSLATDAFPGRGDFGARTTVLAVEIVGGVVALGVGFAASGALVLSAIEGVIFRLSLIPSLRTVPPNRAADDSVGSLGSIFVRGSSVSVILSGFGLGLKGDFNPFGERSAEVSRAGVSGGVRGRRILCRGLGYGLMG